MSSSWSPVVSQTLPPVRWRDLEGVGFHPLRVRGETTPPGSIVDGGYLLMETFTPPRGAWVFLPRAFQDVPRVWERLQDLAPPVLVLQQPVETSRWEETAIPWVVGSPWEFCETRRRLEGWTSPRVYVHGTLVEVFGIGVLLVGPSGVGKTECALDLLHRGHFFVADDLVELVFLPEETRGRSGSRDPHLKTTAEIRGLGLVDVEKLFGLRRLKEETRVDLVVELLYIPSTALSSDRGPFERGTLDLAGRAFPCVRLPVQASKSLGPIVETAVLQFRMEHRR